MTDLNCRVAKVEQKIEAALSEIVRLTSTLDKTVEENELYRQAITILRNLLISQIGRRIIKESKPEFWVIENPANGRLKDFLGKPRITYQPWRYGSPWTKKTALWGNFNIPTPLYDKWEDVPKNDKLYIRPGRPKPALAFLHKSAVNLIPEFQWAKDHIKCDADIRSMCSQGFAKEFYKSNK